MDTAKCAKAPCCMAGRPKSMAVAWWSRDAGDVSSPVGNSSTVSLSNSCTEFHTDIAVILKRNSRHLLPGSHTILRLPAFYFRACIHGWRNQSYCNANHLKKRSMYHGTELQYNSSWTIKQILQCCYPEFQSFTIKQSSGNYNVVAAWWSFRRETLKLWVATLKYSFKSH